MGGPALHVAYLSAGLAERGYETTLVAGALARGEDSMAFVAEELGVRIVQLDALSREISPLRDAISVRPARAPDPRAAPADPAHAHREGRRGRPPRGAARGRRAAADRRPHLPRPRPARLLRPGQVDRVSPARAAARAGDDAARRRQPAGARRPRRARRRARGEVQRRPARDRARRARADDGRPAARRARRLGIPPERFVVGWVGRMTGVKRTDDVLESVARLRDARRRRDAAAWSATAPTATTSSSARASSGSSATASSSATRRTSRTGTRPSTR